MLILNVTSEDKHMDKKGQNIYEARKKAGLTLEELGKKVGVSKSTIRKYEIGEITNIPSDKIEKIAHATGTSEAFIMGWENLREENAAFHASILKDNDLLDLIVRYRKLADDDKLLISNMIDSLSKKKN